MTTEAAHSTSSEPNEIGNPDTRTMSDVAQYQISDLQGAVLFEQLALAYRTLFGEKPWNEWKLCQNCGSNYGLDSSIDSCCGQETADYHPPEKVKERIVKELGNPDFSSTLLIAQDAQTQSVNGFIWGYAGEREAIVSSVVSTLNESFHFNVDDDGRRSVDMGVQSAMDVKKMKSSKVTYISELGVVQKKRDIRLLGDLLNTMATNQMEKGIEGYVSWTQRGSSIYPVMMVLGAVEAYSFDRNQSDDVFLVGRYDDVVDTLQAHPGRKFIAHLAHQLRNERKNT